jgi:hypothetical protein
MADSKTSAAQDILTQLAASLPGIDASAGMITAGASAGVNPYQADRRGRGFGSLEANIASERDAHGGNTPGAWHFIGRLPRQSDGDGGWLRLPLSSGNSAYDRYVIGCACHADADPAQQRFVVGAGDSKSEAGAWFGLRSVPARLQPKEYRG